MTKAVTFQTTIKQFKSLLTPANIKKATTEDLLALKEALMFGIDVLNKQVETLSAISITNKPKSYVRPNINNDYASSVIQAPDASLSDVKPISLFDTDIAVSLFDAEAEVNRNNQMYLESVTPEEAIDEVQVLEDMFSSVEDVKQ